MPASYKWENMPPALCPHLISIQRQLQNDKTLVEIIQAEQTGE